MFVCPVNKLVQEKKKKEKKKHSTLSWNATQKQSTKHSCCFPVNPRNVLMIPWSISFWQTISCFIYSKQVNIRDLFSPPCVCVCVFTAYTCCIFFSGLASEQQRDVTDIDYSALFWGANALSNDLLVLIWTGLFSLSTVDLIADTMRVTYLGFFLLLWFPGVLHGKNIAF